MQPSERWLQGIQYFRALVIINIVLLHAIHVERCNPWVIVALQTFTLSGVPLFIFISGVVLYNKHNNGFSLSTFYKKRFTAIIPPFVVWSTVYFAFFYLIPPVFGQSAAFQYAEFESTQNLTILATAYLAELTVGIQQLWFIIVLLLLYLLYPLLERVYSGATRHHSPIYVLSAFLLVQIGYCLLTGVFPPLLGVRATSCTITFYSLQATWYFGVLAYVFYFVFGFFVAQHYEAMKQKVATMSLPGISLAVLAATVCYAAICYSGALSTTALSAYVWPWLVIPVAPFYYLILILFYLKLTTSWGEPRGFFLSRLERVGEDSFGIFLVHVLFLWIISSVLIKLGFDAHLYLFYSANFFLTIIMSYAVVETIYHLPRSTIIIGARRRKQYSPSREHRLARPTALKPTNPTDSVRETVRVGHRVYLKRD
ncbi:MAG: acyltransferase family protein [Halobacteriota archaeon]